MAQTSTTIQTLTPQAATRARRTRLVKILLLLFALLLLVQFARLALTLNNARVHATALLNSTHESDASSTAAAVGLLNDYRDLRGQVGWVVYLGPLFGSMPRYGGDLAAAPQLLRLADSIADAAEPSLSLYGSFLKHSGEGQSYGAALISVAKESDDVIKQARLAVNQARVVESQIDTSNFSPELKKGFVLIDEILPAWSATLSLLERAPVFLGADGTRNYLLLAQNSDELRATGGFISGVGVLSVRSGQISIADFGDSYSIDNPKAQHPSPPDAMRKYLFAPIWLIRDANWYADFPTTAEVAQTFYRVDRGVSTDGVIAVDTHLLPLLLRAFGTVHVDATGDDVTAENVMSVSQSRWNPPPDGPVPPDWWAHRKDFLGAVLNAMMARLRNGQFQRTPFGLAIWEGLRSKNILVHFNDVDADAALSEANWDGALARPSADHLMVLDTNVGFNKVNAVVTEAITYTVALNAHGGSAQVDIAYHHIGKPGTAPCDHRAYYGRTYSDLQDRCYFDYVRVIAPASSRFISAQGVDDAGVTDDLSDVTALQGYFVLQRGDSQQVHFEYALPPQVSAAPTYQLALTKQAGAIAMPLHIHVELPNGWSAGKTNFAATARSSNALDFDLTLDHDTTLVIYLNKNAAPPWSVILIAGLVLIGGGIFLLRRTGKKQKAVFSVQ